MQNPGSSNSKNLLARFGHAAAMSCIVPYVLLVGVATIRAEIIDRVLAVVDGAVITLSDVTAASELGLVPEEAADDRIGAVLARLINRQLILREVDRYTPSEPTEEAVDQEVATVRARFTSPEAYASALTRSGLDDKRLRLLLRDSLRIRAYVEQRFSVPPPGDEELRRYYSEHLQEFAQAGQPAPFENVRTQIDQAVVSARRETLVDDWVNGLRRRADIINVYLARR
jgi:hypothetical protein